MVTEMCSAENAIPKSF